MEKIKLSSCLLVVLILGFTSCITDLNMRSMDVEILKPASFTLPANIDKIAIFKRGSYQTDTIIFRPVKGYDHGITKDTSVHNPCFSNKCVDALAILLEKEGNFLKVINYRDTMNYLFPKDKNSIINYPDLQNKLGVDAFVFLDVFKLKDYYSDIKNGKTAFMSRIEDKYPDFQYSTKIEYVDANLLWSINLKGDSTIQEYKHHDNLYYGNSIYPELFDYDTNHQALLTNSAEYLGESFARKIIPSWNKVSRSYYRSNNSKMRLAEKHLLAGEWLNAAEIYSKKVNSKDSVIVAKATFNMALICEMEGNMDAAFNWLAIAKGAYNPTKMKYPLQSIDYTSMDVPIKIRLFHEHQVHCRDYTTLLTKRKNELELLKKQVRQNE